VVAPRWSRSPRARSGARSRSAICRRLDALAHLGGCARSSLGGDHRIALLSSYRSQKHPGFAVLRANAMGRRRTPPRRHPRRDGLGARSADSVNLAAITAALCAGPDGTRPAALDASVVAGAGLCRGRV